MHRAVFFFCVDPIDPVAGRVLKHALELYEPSETSVAFDGWPVLATRDAAGDEFHFVRTNKVLSHDYLDKLPSLRRYFGEFDVAGIVNWHYGQNAPERILTVHTTGDVMRGSFGRASPTYMRALLLALERSRAELGLDAFRVTPEATHWSGTIFGGDPDWIPEFRAPVLDIEIGSEPDSWGNHRACEAVARSLIAAFRTDGLKARNLLCVGGVHFEPAFAEAVFRVWDGNAFGISHILANQWLVAGAYEEDSGMQRLERCIESIEGGVEGIVFHDNLKGAFKDKLRAIGQKRGIPVFKHQKLRNPAEIRFADAGSPSGATQGYRDANGAASHA